MNYRSLKKQSGFTIIEILMVLTIVAGLIVVVLPRISPIDRLRAAVRKLTVISRETQTTARLSGSIYRIVIEMPDDNDKKKSPAFWVEASARKDLSLETSDISDKDKKEGEDTTETGFAIDSKITKKKEGLPSGFYFEDVEFSETDKITNGKAYIYFFPQGYVTKAAIHITNRKNIHWSIFINPLTGYCQILDEYKSLRDAQ